MLRKLSFAILAIIVCMVACTSDEAVPTGHGLGAFRVKQLQSCENHVTLDNVMMLTSATRPQSRALCDNDIVPILGSDGDTLFFVVNHPDGGWTMYATDKRVPAVVAENESGHFNLEETKQVMGTWFDAMKEDMKLVKRASDIELNFTSEEIGANVEFWESRCAADTYVRSCLKGENRLGGLQTGHYELDTTYSLMVIYDTIDHLTQTRWHQHPPYNSWCPLKSSGSERAPAGCVAIAGAQMLYYLHSKIGVPEFIPDSAYCYGNVNNYIYGQFSHNDPNFWLQLYNDGNSYLDGFYAAPLVANVGNLVGMNYADDGSSADTEDLVDHVFNYYGISCQYSSYDKDLLYASLLDSIPVIARAKRNLTKGHAFIIDAYKRKAMMTTYIYRWVPDFLVLPINPGQPVPIIDPGMSDSIVHTYNPIYFSFIKMNWGWGNNSNNDTWFAPTEDWIVTTSDGDTYNFNRQRHMIWNFRRIEN